MGEFTPARASTFAFAHAPKVLTFAAFMSAAVTASQHPPMLDPDLPSDPAPVQTWQVTPSAYSTALSSNTAAYLTADDGTLVH